MEDYRKQIKRRMRKQIQNSCYYDFCGQHGLHLKTKPTLFGEEIVIKLTSTLIETS